MKRFIGTLVAVLATVALLMVSSDSASATDDNWELPAPCELILQGDDPFFPFYGVTADAEAHEYAANPRRRLKKTSAELVLWSGARIPAVLTARKIRNKYRNHQKEVRYILRFRWPGYRGHLAWSERGGELAFPPKMKGRLGKRFNRDWANDPMWRALAAASRDFLYTGHGLWKIPDDRSNCPDVDPDPPVVDPVDYRIGVDGECYVVEGRVGEAWEWIRPEHDHCVFVWRIYDHNGNLVEGPFQGDRFCPNTNFDPQDHILQVVFYDRSGGDALLDSRYDLF